MHQEIFLCDAYISSATSALFLVFRGKVKKVKILTKKIKHKPLFLTHKALYEILGIQFEVKENSKVHDRFLLYGNNRCIMIGSSLDDLGMRDTTVVEDPNHYTSKIQLFNERWAE